MQNSFKEKLIELFEIQDDILHNLPVVQDPICTIDLHAQKDCVGKSSVFLIIYSLRTLSKQRTLWYLSLLFQIVKFLITNLHNIMFHFEQK